MADADFVSNLDAKTLAKAEKELCENPKERLSAVQTLREWITAQKHLSGPTDTLTLLAFLRGNKFSQLMARQMYERYLTAKCKMPEFMEDVDTHDAKVIRAIEEKILCKLPLRDKEGRTILLRKPAKSEAFAKESSFKDLAHLDISVLGTFLFDETAMVNGVICLVDMTGMTMKQFTKDAEHIRRWSQVWEGHFPGRFKEFHFYNTGTVFEAINAIIRPFLSQKMQNRMRVHSTMESVYKYIPMEYLPEEYLPDDYDGPNAGKLEDCIRNFKNEIQSAEVRRRVLEFTSNKHKIDLTRKPGDSVPQASFRKLTVD